jgi:hypothetical protein
MVEGIDQSLDEVSITGREIFLLPMEKGDPAVPYDQRKQGGFKVTSIARVSS